MSEDLHTPTTAAPTPGGATADADATSTTDRLRSAAPEPLTHAAQSAAAAVASAREKVAGGEQGEAERPELLVGAAFAGGLVAALILKRLGR